jgi:UDP-2,4-diacetamido-2,4,6-trideoxy-beta-L-altropyranose hydrolase
MRNYLFRCDVSPNVGTGHFRRCLVLAKELKELGAGVFFACRMTDFEAHKELSLLCDDWTPIEWSLPIESDAQEVLDLYKHYQIDIAVIDHYRINVEYQLKLYKSGVRWLQFDGNAQHPLWADWVINPRLDAKMCDYTSLRQRDDTQFLLGPAYAFLRREFIHQYNRVCFNKQVKEILITFGGGDDRGAIAFCLEATKKLFPDVKRVVLTTSENPRNGDIARWMKKNRVKSELIVDDPEIARRMAEADMGIVSGGMTTFETSAMGLPCLIVQIAENQKLNAKAWHEAGVSINLGSLEELNKEVLCQQVQSLIERPKERENMHMAGRSLVDCRGAKRVARKLIEESK